MKFLSKINLPMIWIVMGSVLIFGYMKIQNLTLELDNAKIVTENLKHDLDSAVSHYDTAIANVTKDIKAQTVITNAINAKNQSNAEELNNLSKMFRQSKSGDKRDLEAIAEAKPTLLQRRINDATKEVGKKIENATDHNTSSSNNPTISTE